MPNVFSHGVLDLRALRSLAADPTSHVTTIALTYPAFRVRERRLDPGGEGTRFLCLVARAAPTGRAVLELLLPCTPRDLVELFKKILLNWKTPTFFELAHDVLGDYLIVSRQRPCTSAHFFTREFLYPRGYHVVFTFF